MTYLLVAYSYIVISSISVGSLVSSGITLYSYLWFLFICHLALRLLFPLKSTKLFNSDYSRAMFITEIVFVFFIATVPSLVSAGLSKYKITPTQCENDGIYYFYETIVPIMFVLCVGVILMLLTPYKIHLVSLMYISEAY